MFGSYTWGGGDTKITGFVKKIYSKCLYKFETLVPFELLPLRLDAAIPTPLQMLETLPKNLSRAANDLLVALDTISVEDFRQCFQHLERCWDCCIQSQGEYFEED